MNRRITQRITKSIKLRDDEHLRIAIIVVLTSAFMLLAIVFAYKTTMSNKAIKARENLNKTGFIKFKGQPHYVFTEYPIKGMRGRILDRTGRYVFAQLSESPVLVFKGAETIKKKPADAAKIWSKETHLSIEKILKIFARKWNGYVVQKDLVRYSIKILKGITKEYGGLAVETRRSRTYPANITSSNVIGMMDNQGKALFGTEKWFDKTLKEKDERFKAFVDTYMHIKIAANINKAQAFNPYELDGKDVKLTLDQRMQVMAYSELARRVRQLKAKGGAVVIMDPHSFQVLAMASAPAIDMDKYKKFCIKNGPADDNSTPCTNKAIQYAYEPGSVGKIFSLTTAINNGIAGLDSRLNTHHGTCKIGRYTVHDTHYFKSPWITTLEATKKSSNCAFAYLGKKMGPKMLYDGLKLLGLGHRTKIELPHESPGYIKSLRLWKPGITDPGASYGYGYRVTPLQIAQAISIIANNGKFGHTTISLERPSSEKNKAIRQVISPETAAAVRKAMITVTQKGGTGTLAVPKGYCVGGKTGTAKINIRGRYKAGHYVATFAGFAPCDNPRLVIVVMIIDPKFHKYGGTAAGPVFRKLVHSLLPLMGLPPKQEVDS